MAKPKKLDTENILSFLNADTHTASDNGDPITKTRIIVTLDQLQPYALNPRKTRNPKYHDILESIESVGLKQPPIITRRHPDDEKYSIRDGGNTRLAVLTELHAKYVKLAEESIQKADKQVLLEKSERFYRFECDFVPFIHDLDALSAHMIENEARGETIFIEKALAVQQFRALFEEEDRKTALESGEDYNEKPLSSRKLANRITAQGWSVDHSHIVRFNYATDVLIQYIPDALWTGAGFHVMRKLSALNKAYTTFWLATPPGQADSSVIEPLFYDTLAEFDSETLSIDAFTEELDVLLSNRLKEHDFDVASISIHAEIQAIMSDTKKSLTYLPGALNQVTSPDDLISDKSGYAPSSINPQSKGPAAKKELDQPDSGEKTDNPQVLSTGNKPALPPNIVSEHLLPNNIEDLRLAIVEQAALLAELAGGPVGLTHVDFSKTECLDSSALGMLLR